MHRRKRAELEFQRTRFGRGRLAVTQECYRIATVKSNMAFNGIDSPDRPMRQFKEKTIESLSIPPLQTDETDAELSERDILLCEERLELSSPTLWPEQGKRFTFSPTFFSNIDFILQFEV